MAQLPHSFEENVLYPPNLSQWVIAKAREMVWNVDDLEICKKLQTKMHAFIAWKKGNPVAAGLGACRNLKMVDG